MLRNNKGFTLVELVVVLAILAILAALAVPKVTGVLNNSRKSADYSACATIAKQINAAFVGGDLKLTDNVTDEEFTSGETIYDVLFGNKYINGAPTLKYYKDPLKISVDLDDNGDDIKNITIQDSDGAEIYNVPQ